MMEAPCSNTKTEWSACVWQKPMLMRKLCNVAYHSLLACFNPYSPLVGTFGDQHVEAS